MANIRLIKRRIKSARSIAQITHAMELVAASRMRKAQAAATAGRTYAQKIYDMVRDLADRVDPSLHPLLAPPPARTGSRTIVVIATNKGLCGALNTNLLRFLHRSYPALDAHSFIVLGKKAVGFLSRLATGRIVADFSQTTPFVHAAPAIAQMVTQSYLQGRTDGVDLVYSEFVSLLKQSPKRKTILPLTIEGVSGGEPGGEAAPRVADMLIEPDPETVFGALLPHYLENQVRDAILQAQASEHAARMIAMRNATDSARGLVSELTLLYNKARQEKITYEITDMVTARLAVQREAPSV